MLDMQIIPDGGTYTDGRRPRGIYPVLWMVDRDGAIHADIPAIEAAGRGVLELAHHRNGKWSCSDWQVHGRPGDIFVRVMRPWNGAACAKAHSVMEAKEWFSEKIAHPVQYESFRAALAAKWPARVAELDALEAKMDALEEENDADMALRIVTAQRWYRKDPAPYVYVSIGEKSYRLAVDEEAEGGPVLEGALPKGCKILGWHRVGARKSAGVYEIKIAVPA